MDEGTLVSTEHHAYLTVDEPDKFEPFFDQGVAVLEFDLNGTTEIDIPVRRETVDEGLGIYQVTHTYLKVHKPKMVVKNKTELRNMVGRYRRMGVKNLWVTRLRVTFKNGDIDEWKRHVIHASDIERDKAVELSKATDRLNALTIMSDTFLGAHSIQKKYGEQLVKITICEKREKRGILETWCRGTAPSLADISV